MNYLYDIATSHHTENVRKTFLFLTYLDWREWQNIDIFSKDAPSKTLHNMYKEIHIIKQKSLLNIFNMIESGIVI
jgi:hypothetical protein